MQKSLSSEMSFDEYKYLIIPIIGLVIGVILAGGTNGYTSDINCFSAWADTLAKTGIVEFYSQVSFCDYPPGYLYILRILGAIKPYLSETAVRILLKSPAIICDFITSVILYKITLKHTVKNNAAMCFCLAYSCFPSVLMTSAVWGQTDSILTMFVLLSIYYLSMRNYKKSTVLIAVAVLFKPQALVFGPVFLFVFLKDIKNNIKEIKNFIFCIFIFIAVFVLGCLPFALKSGMGQIVSRYLSTMTSYPYATLNAANLFGMLGGNFAQQGNGIMSYRFLGQVYIIISVLVCGIIILKTDKKYQVIYASALFMNMVFCLGVRVHERYLFPCIALYLAAYICSQNKRILFTALGISITYFINVLYVYVRDRLGMGHIPYNDLLFVLMAAVNLGIMIFAVVTGFQKER